MEEVSIGLWRVPLAPLASVNAYVLGDVLVDSGARFSVRRLLAAVGGLDLRAHAVTHAHFDHVGSSHAICEHFGIPLWCGDGDREAVESGDLSRILPKPRSWVAAIGKPFAGPGHPVSRTLEEGDEVGGFVAIACPGHTPGHLAFWRESDRALVLGDVVFHRNPVTLRKGLTEPFEAATKDPRMNRDSARKLAALEPAVVCFGHGSPLRDPRRFQDFVSTLPGT
jgi:glyoxylase-like metal-dependent hydrolase (beta-lactamase superfamily II)